MNELKSLHDYRIADGLSITLVCGTRVSSGDERVKVGAVRQKC